MFWLLGMVNTTCWKLFQNINLSFLVYTTGNRNTRSHRLFLETLVDLIFLCVDKEWPDKVSEPPEGFPFEYPRFPYLPREAKKRKLIDELLAPIRGIPGRPKDCQPIFTSLRLHKHIPTTKQGHCVICRHDIEQPEVFYEKKEQQIPGTSVLSFTIGEPSNEEKEHEKQPKRFRGIKTTWKCDVCSKPICKGLKGGKTCWDLFHRQIAR
jgi:hypothetical protein